MGLLLTEGINYGPTGSIWDKMVVANDLHQPCWFTYLLICFVMLSCSLSHVVGKGTQDNSNVQVLKNCNKLWMPAPNFYFSVNLMQFQNKYSLLFLISLVRRSFTKCELTSGALVLPASLLTFYPTLRSANLFKLGSPLEKWMFNCLGPRLTLRQQK